MKRFSIFTILFFFFFIPKQLYSLNIFLCFPFFCSRWQCNTFSTTGRLMFLQNFYKPSKLAIDFSYYVCTVLAVMAPLPLSCDFHPITSIHPPSLSFFCPHLTFSVSCSCHSYPTSLFFCIHQIRITVCETALTSVFFTPFVALSQILAFTLLHFHLFFHVNLLLFFFSLIKILISIKSSVVMH